MSLNQLRGTIATVRREGNEYDKVYERKSTENCWPWGGELSRIKTGQDLALEMCEEQAMLVRNTNLVFRREVEGRNMHLTIISLGGKCSHGKWVHSGGMKKELRMKLSTQLYFFPNDSPMNTMHSYWDKTHQNRN